jgi:hypothetical protein
VRKPVPKIIQHDILIKSRRRCALCYFYQNDIDVKKGQIAHIDRDSSNNKENNLVFLCLEHHDQYDSKHSQTKGFLKEEIITAKTELEKNIKSDILEFVKKEPSQYVQGEDELNRVSLEVYDRRYPIYESWLKLVLSVLTELKVEEKERVSFVKSTSDALFLFGKEIDEYLAQVHKKVMKLRSLQRKMERFIDDGEKWETASSEEVETAMWFERQLVEGKNIFYKYLRIKNC